LSVTLKSSVSPNLSALVTQLARTVRV